MYYNTNAGLKPLVVSDESTRTTVRREALDVMNGEFKCCRLGHPRGEPCDREALMLPLLGLYADIYAERHGKHADAYAFIEPLKDSLFPETFEYVHKGQRRSTRTSTPGASKLSEICTRCSTAPRRSINRSAAGSSTASRP